MNHAWVKREEELVQARNKSREEHVIADRAIRDKSFRLAYTGEYEYEWVATPLAELAEFLGARAKSRVALAQCNRALYWHRNAHAFCVLRVLQSRYWSALPDVICREIVRFL